MCTFNLLAYNDISLKKFITKLSFEHSEKVDADCKVYEKKIAKLRKKIGVTKEKELFVNKDHLLNTQSEPTKVNFMLQYLKNKVYVFENYNLL